VKYIDQKQKEEYLEPDMRTDGGCVATYKGIGRGEGAGGSERKGKGRGE